MKGSDLMRMYFLDSTDDEKHEYNQNGFARFHNQIIGTGVSDVESLAVSAKNNMDVALSSGWIFANGYALELENTQTLKHEVADPDNDRIDRVVIRFDTNPEERVFYPVIKKGIPAGSPVAPPLTRDNYIYEMSVAQVKIIAGKSFVEQDQITDERENDAVCGYIPLHNIYRGLNINEHGMVTMPNQSFIKTRNDEITIPANTSLPNAVPITLGSTEEDKQKEIHSKTQIKVKSDGVYHFWVELGFSNSALNKDAEIHVYLFVNGRQSFPLGTKMFYDPRDNYMVVSGMDSLEKGDVVDFRMATYQMPDDVETSLVRVRSARLA